MTAIANFFTTRGENLSTIPFKLLDAVVDLEITIFGVAASALSVLTFGKSETVNEYSYTAYTSYRILPKLHLGILKVLNPNIKHKEYEFTSANKTGLFTLQATIPIYMFALEYSAQDTFWERHVLSRSMYIAGALTAVVARTVDLALGIFGAALSYATFGTIEAVNEFAIDNLTSFGLVADICSAARGFVNPQQFEFIRPEIQESGEG